MIDASSMEIHYNTSDLVLCRRTDLTIKRQTKLNYYYQTLALPTVALFAGAMLLYTTKHDLVALWVMLIAGSFLARVKSHAKLYHLICYPPGTDSILTAVTLGLSAEGITEEIAGVTSFAPWHAVTDATISGDLLVVQLASRQQALVPENPVGMPRIDLGELKSQILAHKEASRLRNKAEE